MTSATDIPLEIALAIYSACDLETCIDLRAVSSFWYEAYGHADKIVKSKVQGRNGVLRPGEPGSELLTWSHCALVLVTRLRSSKWTFIESLEAVDTPPGKKSPKTIYHAKQVYGRLPSDYRGLLVDCDRSKVNEELILKDRYAVDGRTLRAREITPERDEMGRVVGEVGEVGEGVEVVFKGVRAIFPSKFAQLTNVYMNDRVIIARSGSECYLLPRESCDFRQNTGFSFEQKYYESPEFSNRCSYISTYYEQGQKEKTFRFANLAQQKMENLFSTSANIDAVATYNGLIWFTKCTGKGLAYVPVLLDGSKMYFREDKMIHGIDGRFWGDQGSMSRDAQRYTCYSTETGAEIIDLATGTVTDIQTEHETSHIFAGFSGGQFGAWYFSGKMMEGLEKMLMVHLKVEPGRGVYELSKKPERGWWRRWK